MEFNHSFFLCAFLTIYKKITIQKIIKMETYKINHELSQYDQIEGIEFDGLMPKFINKIGMPIGDSKESKKLFEFNPNGSDSLEIVDIDAIQNSNSGSKPGKTEQDILDQLSGASGSSVNITVPEGETINNLQIPNTVTSSPKITGEIADGATIYYDAPKSSNYVTINNTSENPVSVNVGNSVGSVYLTGDYNDINLSGKSISASNSKYANVNGTISIDDSNDSITGVSLSVNFVGDECGVNYEGEKPLTINDGDTSIMGSPTIYAPNSTVSMGGKYTDVTATVSDNTLILKSGFHANSLNVIKGNVIYYGVDFADFVDELVSKDTNVSPLETEITSSNFNKLTSSAGVYKIAEDIDVTKGINFGILASGKYRYDLNGHTVKCGTKTGGSLFVRGTTPQIDIVGEGKLINNSESYCVWLSAENGVINIYGGEFEGTTHTLYSEKGTINVYGGTFKLSNAETADRDVNGNLKFLVNCLDANYTSGTAKINIYGGKFYEWNPSESYGEPGAPVSFVANGYHVVESTENEIKVYEVVKD